MLQHLSCITNILPRETIDRVMYQFRDDNDTMKSCMLTSRVFAERTRPLLFREKTIVSMTDNIDGCIEVVEQVPAAAYHVKQLVIKAGFSSTVELNLNVCSLAKIGVFMPRVEEMVLEDCSWIPRTCVWGALCVDDFEPWTLERLTLFDVRSINDANVFEVFELTAEVESLVMEEVAMIEGDVDITEATITKIKQSGLTHVRTDFYVNSLVTGPGIPWLPLYTTLTRLELSDIRPEFVDLTEQALAACGATLVSLLLGFRKSAFLHRSGERAWKAIQNLSMCTSLEQLVIVLPCGRVVEGSDCSMARMLSTTPQHSWFILSIIPDLDVLHDNNDTLSINWTALGRAVAEKDSGKRIMIEFNTRNIGYPMDVRNRGKIVHSNIFGLFRSGYRNASGKDIDMANVLRIV